jgi:hypothetical protein
MTGRSGHALCQANRPREVNVSTNVGSAGSTETADVSTIDMALEVVTVPVSDVDRAKEFYLSLGWRLDIDLVVSDDIRNAAPLAVLDPVRQGHDGDGAGVP